MKKSYIWQENIVKSGQADNTTAWWRMYDIEKTHLDLREAAQVRAE